MRLFQLTSVALLFLAACPANDPAYGVQTFVPPDQFLDYNGFVCDVQPVLIRRCSFLACHGKVDHALRIFSVGKLRKAGLVSKADRDAPLSADEVELNFSSASGVVYAASASDRNPKSPTLNYNPLVLKPLAAKWGGSEHHGVNIFPQFGRATPAEDPDFVALLQWTGGQKQASPPSQKCQDLFSSMGLPPRSP